MDKATIIQTAILATLTMVTFIVSTVMFKIDFSQLNARFDTMSARFDTMSDYTSQIIGFIQGKEGQLFVPIALRGVNTGRTQSPPTINAKGKAIADELEAWKLVEKYHNKVLIPEGANEYRIQDLCFDFASTTMFQVITQEERAVIEKKMYEDGGDRNNIPYVYGILCRDFFLKRNGFDVPEYALD